MPPALIHPMAPGQVLRLPEWGPITLRLRSGRAWITQAHCPHDWFLQEMQSLCLSGPRIVIEAETACELAIERTPALDFWPRWLRPRSQGSGFLEDPGLQEKAPPACAGGALGQVRFGD